MGASDRPTADPATADERCAALIAAQRPGRALTRELYCDPAVFERERRTLLTRHWHCIGHQSQAAAPGDYYTVDCCGEPLLVVRGQDGEVRAFYNVCRHRGSRVCTEAQGTAAGGVFVCPYHAWSYGLDGRLRGARQMPEGFDRTAFGLKPVHTRVIEGLVFVSFAAVPLGLAHVEAALSVSARAYGWAQARVAHRETWPIAANWKLAVENYMECYHCGPAHVEYSRHHLYARPAALNTDDDARVRRRARELGVGVGDCDYFGTKASAGEESADSLRSALAEGVVSGSEDGGPVAPLMGEFTDYDGGVTFFDVGATSSFLAYPDHGLIYRFSPRGVQSTEMEVIWLVRADARPGIDYDLERLTWLWRVTSIADKRIIELNQQGIHSRAYEPGPYAPMEQHTQRYIEWVLAEIR